MTIQTARTVALEYGCAIAAAPGGGYIVRHIVSGKTEHAGTPAAAVETAKALARSEAG